MALNAVIAPALFRKRRLDGVRFAMVASCAASAVLTLILAVAMKKKEARGFRE